MIGEIKKKEAIWILSPIFGTIVFIILYGLAAFLYPGGSQADRNAHGFSWINNYWCNLLNEAAINGQVNTARPIALFASFILCSTLSLFWYTFPQFLNLNRPLRLTIQVPGILAMMMAMFLFTDLHDMIINVAGSFGVIALIGTFIALHKIKWAGLFWFGIFNLALVVVNNYAYRSQELIVALPIIQKITFLSFLTWICCINIYLFRGIKNENK